MRKVQKVHKKDVQEKLKDQNTDQLSAVEVEVSVPVLSKHERAANVDCARTYTVYFLLS